LIRTAIIGVSGFGATHYKDLIREIENGRLTATAATIINPEEEAEKVNQLKQLGAHIYSDYTEMLNAHRGELDLCMIPTGIGWHEPMTVAALEAGANVFVEKPAAGTIQEVKSMQAAEKRADRFVAVGYQNMYEPVWRTLKQRVQSGAIGRLQSVAGYGCWPRSDHYYARNNWAGQQRAGDRWVLDSPINNAMAHFVMQTIFAAGTTPEERAHPVQVEAEFYRARDIENLDTAAVRIQTREEVQVYFAGTHCCANHDGPIIEFRGSDGVLRWGFNEIVLEKDGQQKESFSFLPGGIPQREAMFDAIIDRINERDAFICDLELAKGQTIIINATQESTPVHSIDASYIERASSNNTHFSIINGINDLMKNAWHQEKLLNEIGAPWTASGGKMDVNGYKEFTKPKRLSIH
jgi:predicted dehydrogenase